MRKVVILLLLCVAGTAHARIDLNKLRSLFDAGNSQQAYEYARSEVTTYEGDPDFDFYYGVAAIDTGHASYSVIRGTHATDLDGNVAASVANVNLQDDFSAGEITQYGVAATVAGDTYATRLVGTVPITNALLNGLDLNPTTACTTCTGEAAVSFLGDQAQGAATSYTMQNTNPLINNAVNGTAILVK